MKTILQEFLIDDLNKVEHHVNEIIENIYARGQQKEFAKDIEKIEMFFSYWRQHSQIKKVTKVYLIDGSNMISNKGFEEMTDEEFMTESESQGHVYSLQGFQQAFNEEKININTDVIKII